MDENENLEMDTISLLDEDGNPHDFEIADILELGEQEYVALIPLHDEPQDCLEDSGELVILKVSEELDEDGEPYLEAITDDSEYEKVADIFMDRLQDYFDFEEADAD